MLRDQLADALAHSELARGAVGPAWAEYCFANVPDTVLALFGHDASRPLPEDVFEQVPTDIDHVVLAFVDGLGWNHYRRVRDDHPFLHRLGERGTLTPLTSCYPSATAAAISTIHTGRQPVEHGILGWRTYDEELGGYVKPLPFSDAEGTPLHEVRENPDPAALISGQTIYDRLDAGDCDDQHDARRRRPRCAVHSRRRRSVPLHRRAPDCYLD